MPGSKVVKSSGKKILRQFMLIWFRLKRKIRCTVDYPKTSRSFVYLLFLENLFFYTPYSIYRIFSMF